MKKLFGNINIKWKNLILFSIILGLIVGVLKKITILDNTSFQDIATYLEMWIILAIFVIVNSKTWKEAVSKCFIFFLISQPVIYLTELIIDVAINGKTFQDTFKLYFINYYLGAGWLTWTILTIPGAFIAYQIKKDNILSSIILSVATSFLAFTGITGLLKCLTSNFPYHLINSLICLTMAYYFIFIILKNKKNRIISIAITSLALFLGIAYFMYNYTDNTPAMLNEEFSLEENVIISSALIAEPEIAKILSFSDNSITISTSNKIGTTTLTITDTNNQEYIYTVEVTKQQLNIYEQIEN